MIVAAIFNPSMQIHAPVDRQRLKNVFDQITGQAANLRICPGEIENVKRATTKIYRDKCQRFIHRHIRMSGARDASFITQRSIKRHTQTNRHIFDRMMLINVQITNTAHRQIKLAVPGKAFQQVIVHANARLDVGQPAAIQMERQGNVGFAGAPFDGGRASHGTFLLGAGVLRLQKRTIVVCSHAHP